MAPHGARRHPKPSPTFQQRTLAQSVVFPATYQERIVERIDGYTNYGELCESREGRFTGAGAATHQQVAAPQAALRRSRVRHARVQCVDGAMALAVSLVQV